MIIKKPKWVKDAILTTRGWVSKSGELLVARKIPQQVVDEYNGTNVKRVPDLDSMTKRELLTLAKENGLDFGNRTKKSEILFYLKEYYEVI